MISQNRKLHRYHKTTFTHLFLVVQELFPLDWYRRTFTTVELQSKCLSLTIVMPIKDDTPISNFQPIRLPDLGVDKNSYLITNSADLDVDLFKSQLIWIYTICKSRAYLGSVGEGLYFSAYIQGLGTFLYEIIFIFFSDWNRSKQEAKKIWSRD